jgi:hypothetical protein
MGLALSKRHGKYARLQLQQPLRPAVRGGQPDGDFRRTFCGSDHPMLRRNAWLCMKAKPIRREKASVVLLRLTPLLQGAALGHSR